MSDERFSLESIDTRLKPIKLPKITAVSKSTSNVKTVSDFSEKQLEAFTNIEKIKRSAGYYSGKNSDVYKIDALKKFLAAFGKYPKNLKKADIIQELVNLYVKYNPDIKTEVKRDNVSINLGVTMEDYSQL